MALRFFLAFILLVSAPQEKPVPPGDQFAAFVTELEKAVRSGNREATSSNLGLKLTCVRIA